MYLVVIAAVLLTIGRLADMIGHKVIWAGGLAIFTTGSAICGAAPSLGLLIAARGLQGIGGAMLMAISPAMLTRAFPANERGRALGMNAVIVALGVSVGPTLGGIITDLIIYSAAAGGHTGVYWDIALRDFGLLLAALALARLAAVYAPNPFRRR